MPAGLFGQQSVYEVDLANQHAYSIQQTTAAKPHMHLHTI